MKCCTKWISHHPRIECLAFSDVLVGGAGYNTVYECASLGVPLVAIALERLYDRQDKRASKCYWVQDIQSALDTVKMLLDRIELEKKPSVPSYINGVVQAVRHIMSYQS